MVSNFRGDKGAARIFVGHWCLISVRPGFSFKPFSKGIYAFIRGFLAIANPVRHSVGYENIRPDNLGSIAARDNGVPFYVALPSTTIDWELRDGVAEIPIEERPPEELTLVRGRTDGGELVSVAIAPPGCPAGNYAFDVTPARLVTGLVTERGVCDASMDGLLSLFPERRDTTGSED